jgi:GWxTD domain-containing protein
MTSRRAIHALLLVLALGGALACSSGAPARSAADLTNPFLGPERSSWLIGPLARIATREEVDGFLALRDDAQAEAFIDRFWASRDATPNEPDNPLRQAFEERAAEADRLYSEAGYRGRRTDRGTIHVLYGPPSKTDFEVSPLPGDPAIELWTYTSAAPAGLDGKRPASAYRFIKRGDLTVFYVPRQDPRLRDRPEPDPF